MTDLAVQPAARRAASAGWLVALLALPALALTLHGLAARLPPALWLQAVLAPDPDAMEQLLVHHGFLPRLVVAWLAGAALALAGTLFQQVLRNPLAEPTTLGVSAGAQLALTAATLFAPALLAEGRELVALAGAAGAMLLVFALAWRRALAPTALVLAGLLVTLYAGSAAAVLVLFNHDYLQGLFIWQAGSLAQNGWDQVLYLLPRLALVLLLSLFLLRPLGLFDLGDEGARGLGLALHRTRLLGLSLAVALGAFVVSAVGVIGFVGLAAPALVRFAGARRFRDRLLWSPLAGAALLWLTDQLVQLWAGGESALLPTGAVTALLGAPLLLWLMRRLRGTAEFLRREEAPPPRRSGWPRLLSLALLLPLAALLALAFGGGPQGWQWSGGEELAALLPWRLPRVEAALAAGLMLALAGTLLQRLTGNPMASPEFLGLSFGAAIGAIAVVAFLPGAGRGLLILGGTLGAAATLLLTVMLARRAGYAPERLLLAGIAVGTAMSALVALLLASGDPRLVLLLTWMAGSTYAVGEGEALFTLLLALALLLLVPLCRRWLELLPLGEATARGLGMATGRARLTILLLAALLTAGATLLVGPLSFVGLMAPHMARLLGLARALPQLLGAALLGALILVLADWLGRNLLFPYQIPAGLAAAFIGGPYLLWLMRRR